MGNITAKEEITSLINYATKLHGHLGPFLVLGVKISLSGMNKLGIKRNNGELQVEVELLRQIPYTCTLDGIQATTQCTFGNQKLTLKESTSPIISAKFNLKNQGKQVILSVKNEVLDYLIENLKGAKNAKEAQKQLAWTIMSMPEEKLFSIKFNKQ